MIQVGHVREIVRYPIKSMAGTATKSAFLGWHGLEGDRRFAFRRVGDDDGFPWLSASRLPQLLLYQPIGIDETTGEPLPTHVRTPDGSDVALRSAELRAEILAFVTAVRDHQPPAVSGLEGRNALALALRALERIDEHSAKVQVGSVG